MGLAEPGPDGARAADRRGQLWRSRRARAALLFAVLALLSAGRIASVYRANVNWDEFALLDRARLTLETGELVSGGRPGLAVLVLMPFVSGCEDEIATVHRARLLWLGFTAAFLLGLAALAAQLQRERARRAGDALFAVALLALVPAFLSWSLQVRADQIALACGAWGGVALLASRRRPAWALASGALFGVGMLASQKVAYLGALAALLAAGQALSTRDLRPAREALRGALSLAAFGAVLFAAQAATQRSFEVAETHAASSLVSMQGVVAAMGPFEFYRRTVGFSQYREMLPSLVPHAALLLALVATTVVSARRGGARQRELVLAWAVLLLGMAVCAFHAGAFFYFWMTLGVFPALAFAIARAPMQELLLPSARARRLAVVALGVAVALPAGLQMASLLRDGQAVQRESLDFVHANFPAESAGFHPERSPFCWQGEQPLPPFFSMTIYNHLGAATDELRRLRLGRMVDTFRGEPVRFLVQSFRLNQFPVELRRFWADNYQPYRASVFVLGKRLGGPAGALGTFEIFAPARYRWLPAEPHPVEIDGVRLAPGDVVELAAGVHTAHFVDDVSDGALVLALADPPEAAAPQSFYEAY